jgi:hypothetical protein
MKPILFNTGVSRRGWVGGGLGVGGEGMESVQV